jgi:hypothetical protein
MSERSIQIRERLFEVIHQGELENCDLIKIVEHIANDILNCKTKSNYCKDKISKITGRKKSYHAWRWAKEKLTIDGVIFIIDNE